MNSRERLLVALKCQEPDRVPISTYELVGYNSKAWENMDSSYARLMDSIREKTDCICMWEPNTRGNFITREAQFLEVAPFMETEGIVETDIEQWDENYFHVTRLTAHTPKGDLSMTNKVRDDIHTTWITEHWCKNLEDVDKALSIPFEPLQYDFSDYARIKAEVGENGIIMSSIADPLCLAAELMEFGEFTVWAMTETKHFAHTVNLLHERSMENLKNMLNTQVVDLYRICGPEYATPPYLPPQFFEEFVVPYVKEMTALIHSRGGKVRLHSHGKIKRVIEMILETGVDAIDPCEAPPDGDIYLAEVKKYLGNQICIFGNLQLKLLEHASTDEVKNAVVACMEAAKTGGGFVIMPTAAPINTPLEKKTEENYLCFIDTALENGKY
jgi:uroporphyrinogen-III decarboxylase